MTFGFDINKVTPNGAPKTEVQQGVNKRVENTDAPVIDNKVKGEFGDKLLEQVQPTFVQAAKIPEADAVELKEMFEMAKIKNPIMPTVAQYNRIANCNKESEEKIDKLTVNNNVNDLFKSEGFGKLNKLFNIY